MKYSILLIVCIFIYSCNSLNGKIEERESGKIYLVNTSTSKEYQFTVKETVVINDSLKDYNIYSIPVIAGGEKFLGKKDSIMPTQYPLIEKEIDLKNDPLGILKGIKVPDSTHPLPITKFKYNYEVTGQITIKSTTGEVSSISNK